MKQRKKILAALLAAVVLCGVSLGAAGAAKPDSPAHPDDGAAFQPLAAVGAFTDVPEGAWYAEAANWCLSQGILTGTALSPDLAMTRATVSDALYRAKASGGTVSRELPGCPCRFPIRRRGGLGFGERRDVRL